VSVASNPAVISVRDLVVGFGDVTVLDHASLDVFDGEILGFVGGSGAGKSVLVRFSNSGLKEYEAFAVEGRKTLVELHKAIKNINDHPSRLIFGR
jgi:ABC-type transporter Mla maintaining outer membrane lipid asymmetry ATPase subunit MlaF